MRTIKSLSLVACLLSVLGIIVIPALHASAASTSAIALNYGSAGWLYKEVSYDGEPGFQESAFDATAWAVGSAAFGTTDGVCSWNNADRVTTAWTPNSDLLLRHGFAIPSDAGNVRIEGTVDNNADVYVNGVLLQHVENGFCTADGISIDVPANLLGNSNVIAIRGRDLGDAAFLDVRITYVPLTPLHAGTFIDVLGAAPYENIAPGDTCTTSFSVSKGSNRYVLGAAHCLRGHGVVTVWPYGSRVSPYGSVVACGATGLLVACLPAPPAAVHPDFFAWQPDVGFLPDGNVMTGKGLLPVLGSIVPRIGDEVCHYGVGSGGEVCGKHVLVDSLGDYGTKAYAVPGDSGGPAYEYVPSKKKALGVKAVGIVVEGQYHTSSGATKAGSSIIPITTIMTALGVDLIPG